MPRGIYKRTPEYRAKMSASMKGHKVSDGTRAKIGAANSKNLKGRLIPSEHRKKMIAGLRKRWEENKVNPEFMKKRSETISRALKGKYVGELGANWRGGINQNERMSLNHENWKQIILERDDYTCQICLGRGIFLHVDHIKSFAKYPELRFDASNGRALCRPCHYYVTFKRKMPKGSRWGIGKRQVGILDLA